MGRCGAEVRGNERPDGLLAQPVGTCHSASSCERYDRPCRNTDHQARASDKEVRNDDGIGLSDGQGVRGIALPMSKPRYFTHHALSTLR
jgi:hypothetical protein